MGNKPSEKNNQKTLEKFMKTKRSIFLTVGLFLAISSISTQLLSTIPSDSEWLDSYEIMIQVKKAEDKDELIRICEQNKHKFTKPTYFLENWYLVNVPGNKNVNIAVDQYEKLTFVVTAFHSNPALRSSEMNTQSNHWDPLLVEWAEIPETHDFRRPEEFRFPEGFLEAREDFLKSFLRND
jgi:hypothetical protein